MSEGYWTVSEGISSRSSYTCRQCRKPIYKGTRIICRDGRKIRLTYHIDCFSGDEDPRTQTGSSFHDHRFKFRGKRVISEQAPESKGYGKWYTSYGLSFGRRINTRVKKRSMRNCSDQKIKPNSKLRGVKSPKSKKKRKKRKRNLNFATRK